MRTLLTSADRRRLISGTFPARRLTHGRVDKIFGRNGVVHKKRLVLVTGTSPRVSADLREVILTRNSFINDPRVFLSRDEV